jgi:hypothetical protein
MSNITPPKGPGRDTGSSVKTAAAHGQSRTRANQTLPASQPAASDLQVEPGTRSLVERITRSCFSGHLEAKEAVFLFQRHGLDLNAAHRQVEAARDSHAYGPDRPDRKYATELLRSLESTISSQDDDGRGSHPAAETSGTVIGTAPGGEVRDAPDHQPVAPICPRCEVDLSQSGHLSGCRVAGYDIDV